MQCPHCQTQNPDESRFCMQCGTALQPAQTTPQPPAAPAPSEPAAEWAPVWQQPPAAEPTPTPVPTTVPTPTPTPAPVPPPPTPPAYQPPAPVQPPAYQPPAATMPPPPPATPPPPPGYPAVTPAPVPAPQPMPSPVGPAPPGKGRGSTPAWILAGCGVGCLLLVVIAVVVASIFIPRLRKDSGDPVTITDISLSRAIDDNGSPTEIVPTLTTNDRAAYICFQATARESTHVNLDVLVNGEVQEGARGGWDFEKGKEYTAHYDLTAGNGFPAGSYQVKLYLTQPKQSDLGQLTFTVAGGDGGQNTTTTTDATGYWVLREESHDGTPQSVTWSESLSVDADGEAELYRTEGETSLWDDGTLEISPDGSFKFVVTKSSKPERANKRMTGTLRREGDVLTVDWHETDNSIIHDTYEAAEPPDGAGD